ncbi:hypothetical protein [Burkholderia ubonensis]|nr:hypothetical protein [Burkholderia ubonensis]
MQIRRTVFAIIVLTLAGVGVASVRGDDHRDARRLHEAALEGAGNRPRPMGKGKPARRKARVHYAIRIDPDRRVTQLDRYGHPVQRDATTDEQRAVVRRP